MTDRQTEERPDREDREDPVLVRPYVSTGAQTAEFGAVTETWPEDSDLPDEPADPGPPSVVTEPPAAKPERSPVSPLARAAIFCGGVAVALAVVGYLVFGPGNDPGLPQPGTALPAMPAQPPLPTEAGSAAPSASGSPSATSASPSVSAASASQQPLVPVSPSLGASAPAATSAPATSAAPPPVDRTGAITASSGRCLALGGLFGMDGSPVTVAGCNGNDRQTFTLATDGTLRVDGRCASASGNGSVRVGSCDDAPRWRAGSGGTLVAGDGGCLTDPGRAGATTTVAECSGGAEQTWTLP